MGSYFRSIPLTASNTEAATMAPTRVESRGFVPTTRFDRNASWVQSVTSSARAMASEPQRASMAETT
jgi:uncharacterized protein (DUF2342 family)